MGTRSLTRINTATGDKILNLYRQMDGYPSGHGLELFEFLDGFEIVNGFTDQEGPKAANGAGCLAAQLVTHFKGRANELPDFRKMLHGMLEKDDKALRKEIGTLAQWEVPNTKLIGGFYLMPVSETDCGQEYEYVITVTEADWKTPAAVDIKVLDGDAILFAGTVAEFGEFCKREA